MSDLKRSASALSNDEDGTLPTTSKTVNTVKADFTDLFKVEIKVPSELKAARNDYQSPSSVQLKMRSIFKGGGASPLTEEERRELVKDFPIDLFTQEAGDEDDSATNSNFDEYEEFDWFEAINGNIHLKQADDSAKQDPVGFCSSALIRRNRIRAAFYHEIEEPTEESAAMGFSLFDRYGRLKPAFKKHAFKSGSGIWGDELDKGDIHLIDQVRINESHRQKGLGKVLLEAILARGIAKSNPDTYVAIARDAVFTSEIEHKCRGKTEEEKRAMHDRQQQISQSFLRSLGFRRIGSSEWFARAGDKQHRCHSLPADQDFDPPRTSLSVPNVTMDTLTKDLKAL